MIVSFTYLGCCIEIDLPDPEDSNVIYIALNKAPGTYDPNEETGFLGSYQFSGVANDPNQWLVEAISSAIDGCAGRGMKYYEQPPLVPRGATDIDASDIPF